MPASLEQMHAWQEILRWCPQAGIDLSAGGWYALVFRIRQTGVDHGQMLVLEAAFRDALVLFQQENDPTSK